MKPSESLFNRDLYDLDYEFLQGFFSTAREENLHLEFKSFDKRGKQKEKEDAIKKAVCGMLNSEGGIVIWGAPAESKDENGNTSVVGNLTPFQTPLDRDRMINILSSSIVPLPPGIRVQPLQNQNGESVFVIEVEKAVEKPFQFDNSYYIRLDGQTKIAPHYLISALMKGINFPVLSGHLRLKQISHDGFFVRFHFKSALVNTSAFINDINVQTRLLSDPGTLYINGEAVDQPYTSTMSILSHGTPHISTFYIAIPAQLSKGELSVAFQFGGEKSPSKISYYTYHFANLVFGMVADENLYLTEKKENSIPDIDPRKTLENIENILNE